MMDFFILLFLAGGQDLTNTEVISRKEKSCHPSVTS